MAYDTDWPLRDEFEALIRPWLEQNNLSHYDWQQIHWALDGLRYTQGVDRGGVNQLAQLPSDPRSQMRSPVASRRTHVTCLVCNRSSSEPDACVLNFASAGAEAQWYCRQHYPETKGLLPAGWMPPAAEQSRRAQATMTAWHKLTGEERALLNRNVVAVASSGE